MSSAWGEAQQLMSPCWSIRLSSLHNSLHKRLSGDNGAGGGVPLKTGRITSTCILSKIPKVDLFVYKFVYL